MANHCSIYGIRRTIEDFVYSFFNVPSFISRDTEQAWEWYHWKGNEMNFAENIEKRSKFSHKILTSN